MDVCELAHSQRSPQVTSLRTRKAATRSNLVVARLISDHSQRHIGLVVRRSKQTVVPCINRGSQRIRLWRSMLVRRRSKQIVIDRGPKLLILRIAKAGPHPLKIQIRDVLDLHLQQHPIASKPRWSTIDSSLSLDLEN